MSFTQFTRDPNTWPSKPVIVLTGGNSGVGFGIAERLLKQLSSPETSDLHDALWLPPSPATSEFATPNGLTLVIAARNAVKAHKASIALLRAVGKKPPLGSKRDWKKTKSRRVKRCSDASAHASQAPLADQYMTREEYEDHWLQNLSVEFVGLDLSSVASVMHCAREISERYDYVSHVILNAGGGPFVGLAWLRAIYAIVTNFIHAVTQPNYMLESKGVTTKDHLGWTWQCNVFGHFLLVRPHPEPWVPLLTDGLKAKLLLDKLYACPAQEPRLIWTGSIDGQPKYYNRHDPQSINSGWSYQSSKFEIGLLAWAFNDLLAKRESQEPNAKRVRSFTVHPGVVAGNMFRDLIGPLLDMGMKLAFYMARWLGSTNHVISAFKAGIAFTFIALAPFTLIQQETNRAKKQLYLQEPNAKNDWTPARYGAQADRFGREYIGIEVLDVSQEGKSRGEAGWDDGLAQESLERCDRLADTFLKVHTAAPA